METSEANVFFDIYCPRTWYDGRLCFYRSVSVRGGVPQVLSHVSGPRSFPGGTQVPGFLPDLWSQVPGSLTGPFLGRGYPSAMSALGYPSLVGVPQSWTGAIPARSGWGAPQHRLVPLSGQNSTANTFFAAGVVPLAFTQDDFLVVAFFF